MIEGESQSSAREIIENYFAILGDFDRGVQDS
jgi:hypothetical protein